MTQDKKNEISFFDQIAEEEKEYIALSTKSYDRLFAELSKCLGQSKKRIKIVDLGCGTGSLTKKLLSLNSEVYGCDISSKCIETVNKLYPNINFSVQDIENLSFDDNFFDVAVFSGVLHHFEDFNKPLMEAKRILKKGGLIFAFDPNINNPFFWLFRRKKSWFYDKDGVTKNEEPLNKKKIKTTLQSCSFNEIKVFGISKMSYQYISSKKLSLFLPVFNFCDYLFNLIPYLRNIIGSFLITTARK